jgi:micrococcal nuclease
VIDGDTIVVDDQIIVRYIGINSPETKDPRKPVECFGDDAYHKNKDLVEGKMVRLEKDVSNSDKYGRWLRYVWLNEKMINEELVLQGFAQIATYPPDVRYHDRLLSAEGKARQDSLGLWSKCTQK